MDAMISAGIELMITGMIIVFTFLAVLVVAVNGLAMLVEKFFPSQPVTVKAGDVKSTSDASQTAVIAAITTAVHQYRKERK